MDRTMAIVGVILVLAACGGSQTATPTEPATTGDAGSAAPVDQMRAVFERQVEALRTRDAAGVTSAYVPDVFVLGLDAADLCEGVERAKVAVESLLPPAAVERVEVKERAFNPAGDRAGWSFHDLTLPGDPPITYRVATVYEQRDGWRVVAQSWAVPIPDDEAARLIQAGAMPDLPDVTLPSSPGTEAIVADIEGWLTRGAVSAFPNEYLMAGSAPDELYQVSASSPSPARAMLENGTGSIAPLGQGIMVRTIADGALAVAHYNELFGLGPEETRVNFPMRMFDLYERHDGSWRGVLAHISLARPQPGR